MLNFWAPDIERDEIHHLLEPSVRSVECVSPAEVSLPGWYAWTVDLPGTYYLQVVEQLFKENRLAAGDFVALGRRIDLSKLHCPMFLLAAPDDDVAPSRCLRPST